MDRDAWWCSRPSFGPWARSVSPGDDRPQLQAQVQAMLMSAKERRQTVLSANVQSLAKVLRTAGYDVVFKGKWHLTKPAAWVLDPERGIDQKYWTDADTEQIRERFGFDGWTMPDAGDNLAIENMGGGHTRNDQRFVDGHGQAAKYGHVPFEELEPSSAVHFLRTHRGERPVCLIVSLVNPHDVLAYPGTGGAMVDGVPLYQAAGYHDRAFQDLPHFTYDDYYFFVPSAGHIRAIVEERWKYAVYFDAHTDAPFEYEMYDLAVPRDVREVENLGHPGTEVSPEVAAERERLHQRLIRVMDRPGTTPMGVEWPERWGEQPGGRAGRSGPMGGFETPADLAPTI